MGVRVVLCLCLCMAPSAFAATTQSPEGGQQWVLQLGSFANLNNAQAFKNELARAGFDVQLVSTGSPGDQRYRVITGRADTQEGLAELASSVERSTGYEGYIVPDPFEAEKVREVFGQPKVSYLVAQAGSDMPLDPSPVKTSGYDTGLLRTPQDEIESMPGFTVGGMPIIPTIGASIGYDDNITAANRDEISSWFYRISPAVRLEIPSDTSVLALIAAAEIVRYQDSSIDNRNDWRLAASWDWDISNRQNLGLFANYQQGQDRRGEGRRQGDLGLIPLEPDKWKRYGFGGAWDYGAVGSRGRLTLRAGMTKLDYTNNKSQGNPDEPGTTALDRDWQYYGGTFYWRVAPKTSLLADYMYTDMSYNYNEADYSGSNADSQIHTWMFGATWDATARTSGRISYGNQKRKFADPDAKDYSGPVWAASVTWRPRTYSAFTLAGTRNTQEPDGRGNYVLRQDIMLSWLHSWATRFGTFVDVGYGEDKYEPNIRKDDLWYWGVGANYTFNPHLRFGGSVNGYDRNSEVEEFNYNRMVYMLTLEASF